MLAQIRKFLVGVVLLAGLAYFLWQRGTERGNTLSLVDANEMAEAIQEERPLIFDDGRPVEVAVEVDREAAAAAPQAPPAPSQRVRGRGIDASGAPLAGVAVVQEHPYLSAGPVASASDGTFELSVEEARGALATDGDGWLLVGGELHLYPGEEDGYFLVVAKPAIAAGKVVDAAGRPLADAMVRFVVPSDVLVPFGSSAMPLESEDFSTWTDDEGRFRLERVPAVAGARVEASRIGFETAAAPAGDAGVELVLVESPPR